MKPIKNPCETAWQRKWLALDITDPKLQVMATEVERLCGRWFRNRPGGCMLVLGGVPGVGKTKVARAAAIFGQQAAFSAWEFGGWAAGIGQVPSVAFMSWPEITDAFKTGHYGAVDDAMEASLLVLDDIGAENDPSKNAANKLCQILSRREQKFTLITTNIGPAAWTQVFDQRIADRLLRNSTIVDLSQVPSYATV